MKITVIKKSIPNAKPATWCASIVDDGLLNKR